MGSLSSNRRNQGGVEEPGMDSDCDTDSVQSEHSAHSVDSGLEESGHSNLEVDGGRVSGELIYENTTALKSNAYLTPVTTAIEKYQFGGHEVEDDDENDEDAGEEKEEEVEEVEEDDKEDSDGVAVPFPPLDLNSSHGVERASSKLWGVRRDLGANGLLGSQVIRTSNPTEDKIAKEIRELKEREEELLRRREMSRSPQSSIPTPTLTSAPPTKLSSPAKSSPSTKTSSPSPAMATPSPVLPQTQMEQEKPRP